MQIVHFDAAQFLVFGCYTGIKKQLYELNGKNVAGQNFNNHKPVAGTSVAAALVVGASVSGAKVVGALDGVSVAGAKVLGALDGTLVEGAPVVGANVVGALVAGAFGVCV